MTVSLIILSCLFPSSLLAVYFMTTRRPVTSTLTEVLGALDESHRKDQEHFLEMTKTLCSSFFASTPNPNQPVNLASMFEEMEAQVEHPEDPRMAEEEYFAMGPNWTSPSQAAQTIQQALSEQALENSSPPPALD